MTADLFDRRMRRLRRDRAFRNRDKSPPCDRAFDEIIDRLGAIPRRFDRALLIGAADPAWPASLRDVASRVDVIDPGPKFAAASHGTAADEDRLPSAPATYDLVVAAGTLDTVNDLPAALRWIRQAMKPDAPFLGVIVGGDSLPALRSAMIAADQASGGAAPRTHPRIEPSSLAGLLSNTGFVMPVVDVDRVRLRYSGLLSLVADLRATAATNILVQRAPGRGKAWAQLAVAAFLAQASGGRVEERVDLLHFLAWSPATAR